MRPEYIKDAIRRVLGTNQRNATPPSSTPTNSVPRSAGLGDTIEKLANATGATTVAKAYTRTTGKDCGCSKRKEALNKAFPYRQ